MAINKFEEKKIEAEILSELYEMVANRERAVHYTYGVVAKDDHQAKDWKTGELLWLDAEKTVPKMEDKWGDIPKEELSEKDQMAIRVYTRLMAALEKML